MSLDSGKLKWDLDRDEARRLIAYRDTNGNWTIGVGHLLGSSPRMSAITNRECDALLAIDIDDARAATLRVFPFANDLGDVRHRALVNMVFNRGEQRMRESSTIAPAIRRAHVTGDWSPLGPAIDASPWAKQVGLRADRIAHMLILGEDP